MGCNYPLKGWRAQRRNATGKRSIVFDAKKGFSDCVVTVPCGQCIGCRLERAREWAIRCVHEADMYDDNCFITLTYNDAYLPPNESLRKSDFQKFMKRLRKEFSSRTVRYFMCGEYGDENKRPHYHACLFNVDFIDKYECVDVHGRKYWRSPTLEKLWPFGFSEIGEVTMNSAGYVARYCLKKITGKDADAHYGKKIPEYTCMSRRPGIGYEWLEKFESDVYGRDEIVVNDRVMCKPPRYYDKKFSEKNLTNSQKFDKIKSARVKEARTNTLHPKRLHGKEVFKKALLKTFKKRRYENGN